jgi:hypothetical protein
LISPPRKKLSQFTPFVSMNSMSPNQCYILLFCPRLFVHSGVKIKHPSASSFSEKGNTQAQNKIAKQILEFTNKTTLQFYGGDMY